jgi:hypothetical protein
MMPFLLMSAAPSANAAANNSGKRVALRSKPLRVAVITTRLSLAQSSTAPLALVASTTSCDFAGTAPSSLFSSTPSTSGPGRLNL